MKTKRWFIGRYCYNMACTPLQLGAGVKNFRKVFAGGEGQKFLFWWGKGLLKRFAPFSYLNHSFILCLNVKVCIRFLPISLFFFICQELYWMRGLYISFIIFQDVWVGYNYSPLSFLRMLLKVNRNCPYHVIQMKGEDFKDFQRSSKLLRCLRCPIHESVSVEILQGRPSQYHVQAFAFKCWFSSGRHWEKGQTKSQ